MERSADDGRPFLLGNKYYVQVRNLWLVIATIFIKMYNSYINLDV